MKYKFKEVRLYLKDDSFIYSEKEISKPEHAVELLADKLKDAPKEYAYVINLTASGKPINYNLVSLGGPTGSTIDVGDVFKSALLSNSKHIIMLHNHPSGSLKPSDEDIEITQRVAKAGELLGVKLLDHIIVGNNEYLSMNSEHYI